MKYKHLIYLLFILLPMASFGNKASLLEVGNQQYAKGQYQKAQGSYQQLINAGTRSAALYFNMGNACFKNGDIPSAIWYYEKAHKLSPGDNDINFNIKFATQKTVDKIEETPEFFISKWWRAFILMFSAHALSVWSVIMILTASLLLILYLFSRYITIKKIAFFSAIALYVIGLAAIFMAKQQVNYFNTNKQAIIFTSSVIVKSAPANGGKPLFVLHEGTKVNVLQTNNRSIKIKLANGNQGWIGLGDVKAI